MSTSEKCFSGIVYSVVWLLATSCTRPPVPPAGATGGAGNGGPADAAASLAAAAPPTSQGQDIDPIQIEAGRQIAVQNCAQCHTLDAKGASPDADAPPLRNALWRFHEDALATHLIEAMRIGHGDMPLFDFNVIGADALIAYLRSIRAPQDERKE